MRPPSPGLFPGFKLWMLEGTTTERWEWRLTQANGAGEAFNVVSNKGTVAEGLSRLAASNLAGLLFQDRSVDLVRLEPSRQAGEWVLLETIPGEAR